MGFHFIVNLESVGQPRLPATLVFICLLLALATLVVYLPVRNFDFLDYDDSNYFFSNPHILNGLTWVDIKWAFTSGEAANWHPLTWLSLMLDAQLFGKGSAAPHVTNVLWHMVNAVLLFVLVRWWTGTLWRSAALAMLFAIHPLHVESVAWISERKDVLSGFFALLTLLCYTRHARDGRAWSTAYWLALFFFACGLMSKPMLVTLPFVMLLLDFWPLQRANPATLSRLFIEKIPFFVLTIASSLVTAIVQQKGGAVRTLSWIPMGNRIQNAFVAYAFYLAKTFWPFDLATPYPHPVHWPVWQVIFSVALFAVFCAMAISLRKRLPYVFTGWFWFAGMLVPVIGLMQVGMPAMSDRYMYLPSIGVFLIIIWSVAGICARWRLPRDVVAACGAILFLACALRANNQVNLWKNDQTLFGHALAVTQNNCIASLDLAFWYSNHGRIPDALVYYDNAMRMSSNDLTVLTYQKNDSAQEALYCYYTRLRLNPDDPTQLYNLANAYARLHYWDEAIRDYRHALQVTPNQPDILDNLGFALAQNKELPEATACFESVLKLTPNSAGAHNNLATIYFVQGRYREAVQQYTVASQLTPNDPRILVNLGDAYLHLSDTNAAVQNYQRALQLQPDNGPARAKLQALGVR